MKTKYLRVAKSGKTVDGREISPAQIDQMAASYSPATYGARIWMEHYRSIMPDGVFRAFGDVLAAKAETDADGARVLLVQVDATPDLVKMAGDRQKVYWSIEIDPNFVGTGQAYLIGLAVTDSPASLGTEMLTFAVKAPNAPEAFKSRLFSTAFESAFEAEDQPKDTGGNFVAKFKDLLGGKGKSDDARFAQLEACMTALAEEVAALKAAPAAFAGSGAVKALSDDLAKVTAGLTELTTKLSTTSATPPRAPAAGVSANTDC